MRALAAMALAAAALAGACTYAPPGECAATPDCEAGLTCQGGVCVGCSGDAACGSWQVCSETHRCVSAPGACGGDAECAAWETCDASHACVVKPGECGAVTDCGDWEACTANRCEPLPGRCSGQEDCPWYQGCRPEHVCGRPLFDPAAVSMWGTLDPAACGRRAVAPVLAPEQARVGFDCAGPGGPAAIGPLGDLFYTSAAGSGRGVGRFEPDAASWSGGWILPASPLANDPVVVAPDACAGAGLDHWLLQAGSGDVLYACPAAGGYDYFDAAGAPRFAGPRVLAWTAGGARLTRTGSGFQVVDGAGAAVPVAGLGPSLEVLAARAHGEAFWLVDGAGFGAPRRYEVGAAGRAVFDGSYAALPPGVAVDAPAAETARLDGAGVLWQRGSDGGGAVVVRRPLAPAAAEVAYREAAAPPGSNDLSVEAFGPYVLLQGGPLVTGP
jgi:hypothetical protein